MIARLTGTIAERTVEGVVVDVRGVGYQLLTSLETLGRLPQVGAEAMVLVHTQVREDAITLFGFADDGERDLFRLLIAVNGIGPKSALTILSGLSPMELCDAIRMGDVNRLVRIPGIGKKSADRLVLELQEKLAPNSKGAGSLLERIHNHEGDRPSTPSHSVAAGNQKQSQKQIQIDLEEALSSLGLKPAEIDKRIKGIRPFMEQGVPLDSLLKKALKG